MRLNHVSLTARDAKSLAAFYRNAFGCRERRPAKRLSGEMVSRGIGLPYSGIYAIWISISDNNGPFLEILEYDETIVRTKPAVNATGFAHLAFEVHDLVETVEKVLRYGGTKQGEIVNFGSDEDPVLIVYMRDPEGNILELEQQHKTAKSLRT